MQKNLKESGKVEVMLVSDESEQALKGRLNRIIEKITIAEGAVIDCADLLKDDRTEEQIRQLERFEVKREDDLHEMVWALQGAGTLFSIATEKISRLLEFKKDERTMRLASIQCELANAQDKLDNAKNMELACLKEFVSNPLIDLDRETLKRLVEFYYEFAEFREAPEEKRKKNLETMSKKIADMLEKIEQLENLLKSREKNS